MNSFDNGYKSERMGYKRGDRERYAKIVSNQIALEEQRAIEIEKRKNEIILEREEKGYSRQLLELGKLCRFVEAYDHVLLSEQNIMPVGPFEDPRITTSFKRGYEAAENFVKNNLPEEKYHEFARNYEEKYLNNNGKHK